MGIKRTGLEADYSPPNSGQVKNLVATPPFPPYVFTAWSIGTIFIEIFSWRN
jgi:hypothetical protein